MILILACTGAQKWRKLSLSVRDNFKVFAEGLDFIDMYFLGLKSVTSLVVTEVWDLTLAKPVLNYFSGIKVQSKGVRNGKRTNSNC